MYVVYVFKMLFVACATCSQGGKASCIGTLTIVYEDNELNEYKLKLKSQMRYKNLKRRFPVLRKNIRIMYDIQKSVLLLQLPNTIITIYIITTTIS